MFRQQALLISNLLIVADGAVFILGGYLSWYIYWQMTWETFEMSSPMFLLMVLILILLNALVLGFMNMYDEKVLPRPWEMLFKLALAVLIEFALFIAILTTSGMFEMSMEFLLVYMSIVFTGMFIVRGIAKAWLLARGRNPLHMTRILLVGSAKRVNIVYEALQQEHSWGHKVIGWLSFGARQDNPNTNLPLLGTYESLNNILHQEALDAVILALPSEASIPLDAEVELCRQLGISIHIVPGMFDPTEKIRGLTVQHIQNVPTLTIFGSLISPSGLFYKRIMDIIGGSIGMMLFLLMYPFVALAIKLDSPGPVLFKQTRVGLNNRHFQLYKFRSMQVDAEAKKQDLTKFNEMQGQMFKMHNDPRITKVGRFLRKTSIDEFPQFINVLKGDMSLVGTRPPTPDEVLCYDSWQRRRVSMKPGVTGLWQISGRNEVKDFKDVVKYDLDYIDGWHFSRDIYILFKTVWVVIAGKGAS